MRNTIETIWLAIFEDIKDSEKTRFYYEKAFEFVKEHVDPIYDKNSLSDGLSDIICALGNAECIRGFIIGYGIAANLAAEFERYCNPTTSQVLTVEYRDRYRPVEEYANSE